MNTIRMRVYKWLWIGLLVASTSLLLVACMKPEPLQRVPKMSQLYWMEKNADGTESLCRIISISYPLQNRGVKDCNRILTSKRAQP